MAVSALGQPVLSLRDIHKVYQTGDVEFQALGGVSLDIHAGEMVALMGPSGSGKTTLMQIIGLLDRPSQGSYHLAGRDVTSLTENERAEARNRDRLRVSGLPPAAAPEPAGKRRGAADLRGRADA
jgi:putative ABC transport system ATP-binding protein